MKAPCPVYEECGGCQLQHLDYKEQLNQKRDIVVQAFQKYMNNGLEENSSDAWHGKSMALS